MGFRYETRIEDEKIIPRFTGISTSVWILDHNTERMDQTRRHFEAMDCTVSIFAEAAPLLNVLEKGTIPDFFITSLDLPDSPNCEILDLVEGYKIPAILVMTDIFGEDYRELFMSKGVLEFVSPKNERWREYLLDFVARLYKNRAFKVLAVDDSVTARSTLKKFLGLLQFNVFTAKDAANALKIYQENPDIAMMIIDFNMPRKNGFELTRDLRKSVSKNELAIIGVSSIDDKLIAPQFLKAGANDFINKPFMYEELLCRVLHNIENLELIQQIKMVANSDFLTKLYNRRYFFEVVPAMLKKEGCEKVASVFDIDFFKKVNDTYGHDVGDEILKFCAELLKKHFGEEIVARFGGEEFVVFFKNSSLESAIARLNDFRTDLKNNPPLTQAGVIPITVSVGVDSTSDTTALIDDLLKKSDLHLYYAKEHGRDQVVYLTN